MSENVQPVEFHPTPMAAEPLPTPAQLEAEPRTVTIHWRGNEFQIPSSAKRAHPKVVRAFESNPPRTFEALEALIGKDVVDRLLDDPTLEMNDLEDLWGEINRVWGLPGLGG